MSTPPVIYFFGDVHGNFEHVLAVVERDCPDAVIFLGDLEAQRPLHLELAPILSKTVVRYIHGNHDTDTAANFKNLFESGVAGLNLHGRVENICGVRIAGLGGVFRSSIWLPPAAPIFHSYAEFAQALERSRPLRERLPQRLLLSRQGRTHRSTIFWDTYSALMRQQADVLVTHEAPSAHPHGSAAVDDLAQAMGVKAAFHGHHHDRRDYRPQWPAMGFKAYGVGFCGITELNGRVVSRGDFD